MENWQLTLVILASVFVGALIPMLIILASAVYRAGREVGEIGAQLRRTLTKVETISGRVEVLSRGFVGGEKNIADLLDSVGALSRSLERNMKIINVLSTIMTSAGSAAAAYMQTKLTQQDTPDPFTSDDGKDQETGPHPSSPVVTREATLNASQ